MAETKREALNKEVAKRLGDLDSLYQLAEINRDYPKDIIENAVYPSVSQEKIDQIIKTRDFARQIKKQIQKSVIKRYSNSYRYQLFEILDCLEIHSHNKHFLDAIELVKKYKKSKLKYYPLEEEVPVVGLISKQEQKYIVEKNPSLWANVD